LDRHEVLIVISLIMNLISINIDARSTSIAFSNNPLLLNLKSSAVSKVKVYVNSF
jgi:hypothetical protein